MHVTYLLGTKGNPVYNGKHEMGGRFHTYGQHSFILDLISTMAKAGHEISLVTDDVDSFPLTRAMGRMARVAAAHDVSAATDLILVDEASDWMLEASPLHVPAVKLVHHAGLYPSAYVVERCQRVICMTENALARQATAVPANKLVLIRQGVDLTRFSPPGARAGRGSRPRVLLYCRMDSGRQKTLNRVIENLNRAELLVYVVGDGPGFWDLSDRFGDELILMNHVPCLSVPNLLAEMDVAISLGRGAMEAMATGIPTICAGYGYAGLVNRENIGPLLKYNLTGAYQSEPDPKKVMEDVRSALATDRQEVRHLAEEHLSIGTFADQLFDLVGQESVR